MHLIWQKGDDAIFGACHNLTGLREGENGIVRRSGEPNPKVPRYAAMAFIADRFMLHRAGTADRARRCLEREIDRRSIGLFGVDEIRFTIA